MESRQSENQGHLVTKSASHERHCGQINKSRKEIAWLVDTLGMQSSQICANNDPLKLDSKVIQTFNCKYLVGNV
jgi:hypothetical protein